MIQTFITTIASNDGFPELLPFVMRGQKVTMQILFPHNFRTLCYSKTHRASLGSVDLGLCVDTRARLISSSVGDLTPEGRRLLGAKICNRTLQDLPNCV